MKDVFGNSITIARSRERASSFERSAYLLDQIADKLVVGFTLPEHGSCFAIHLRILIAFGSADVKSGVIKELRGLFVLVSLKPEPWIALSRLQACFTKRLTSSVLEPSHFTANPLSLLNPVNLKQESYRRSECLCSPHAVVSFEAFAAF